MSDPIWLWRSLQIWWHEELSEARRKVNCWLQSGLLRCQLCLKYQVGSCGGLSHLSERFGDIAAYLAHERVKVNRSFQAQWLAIFSSWAYDARLWRFNWCQWGYLIGWSPFYVRNCGHLDVCTYSSDQQRMSSAIIPERYSLIRSSSMCNY